jgi:UDP-3-O-[3-hydroxymyristoyl] glucosamine N-acyltransferase
MVADGVAIGQGSEIAAGAVIERGVRIGAFCRVGPAATIGGFAVVGNRVSLGAGCAVGGDGFAFVRDGRAWLRVPVFGSVTIGDDAVLLDHVVVHAGVFTDTVIGRGCALDSHVLIGHDARVGDDTAIAGHSALAGAARVGSGCRIGGKAGVGEGVQIADDVTVTAMSMVSRSIDEPGARYSAAWPAEPSALWWRRVAGWRRMFGRTTAGTDADDRGIFQRAGHDRGPGED